MPLVPNHSRRVMLTVHPLKAGLQRLRLLHPPGLRGHYEVPNRPCCSRHGPRGEEECVAGPCWRRRGPKTERPEAVMASGPPSPRAAGAVLELSVAVQAAGSKHAPAVAEVADEQVRCECPKSAAPAPGPTEV